MMFIIFLFYANLLMGQYTHESIRHGVTLMRAISNIFSVENFVIALICAFIGHSLFDRIRRAL
jgi:hypothetical protein